MTTLKRVASLRAGGTPSVDDPVMWSDSEDDGIAWVSISDMSDGQPVVTTARRLSENGVASKRLPIGEPGTVLFAMYASVGAVGRLDIRATWNQALLGVEPRSGLSDERFIRYWLEHLGPSLGGLTRSNTQDNLNAEQVGNFPFPDAPLDEQRAIADYLDAETARIDSLIAKKQQLIRLIDERIDAEIMEVVGRSEIVATGREPSVETRRVLEKLDRTPAVDDMITAFRDGQVKTRAARGKEGFTNSWTDKARVQGVQVGDVVVHGLDGFSGAIGDSEADGVCSPVYHVCQPRDCGDPAFYGRLLRRLALTGYLGNFAVSTRERAVDFRNWDLFGRIPIPHVRVEQQREIGQQIRKVRPLAALVEESESLAAERRSALISRTVSGEFGHSRSGVTEAASGDARRWPEP